MRQSDGWRLISPAGPRLLPDRLIKLALGLVLAVGLTYPITGAGRPAQAAGLGAIPAACAAKLDDSPTVYATVQAAVDAAAPGAVVKVAGACLGVHQRAGQSQVLYVDKSLTIRGGYAADDWATADPAGRPTTLDAQHAGRVVYVTGAGTHLTLEGLSLQAGAHAGQGAGIYNGGSTLTVRASRIVDNTAGNEGGGLFNDHGTVTLEQSEVLRNAAAFDGGGIVNWEGTLAIVNGTRVSQNHAGEDGGGLDNDHGPTQVLSSTISFNTAGDEGGGIDSDSDLIVAASTLLRNAAAVDGGGLHQSVAGADTQTTLTLTHSSLIGNLAGNGAGLYVDLGSTVHVSNATFSGNRAAGSGGGIYFGGEHDGDRLEVINATLTGNAADMDGGVSVGGLLPGNGGGIYTEGRAPLRVQNTIIAGNADESVASELHPDVSGAFESLGYNLLGDSAGATGFNGPGDLAGLDPLLLPLGDYGGPTPMHAVRPVSPALDAGVCVLADDQRGAARPGTGTGACDIGAYEPNRYWLYIPVHFTARYYYPEGAGP